MLVGLMATESEDADGLGWTFGSFVFETAFAKLATSLRWMFWGLLLQIVGAAIAAAPLATALMGLAPLNAAAVLPGLVAMTVGGIVLIIGEQKCLHLELPLGMTRSLPGHGWLRGAYWCHLSSWLLRLARNWLGRGPVSLVLLPLQLIGFVLLLLFLRKTADVLARNDLRRLVDIIFAMAGGAIFAAVLIAADRILSLGIFKLLPVFASLALLALPILLFVMMMGAYAILLWRVASAAAGFARFLGQETDPAASGDEPPATSNEGPL